MGKEYIASFVINLLIHVFILSVFLSTFFFLFISKLTTDTVNNELQSLVSKQVYQFAQNVDQNVDTLHKIDWNDVAKVCASLKMKYSNVLQSVLDNNRKLLIDTVIFLSFFGVVILVMIAYFLHKGYNLHFKFIFLENFIIFLFVGMFEIYFFTEIASHYVPVLPDDAMLKLIEELQFKLSHNNDNNSNDNNNSKLN